MGGATRAALRSNGAGLRRARDIPEHGAQGGQPVAGRDGGRRNPLVEIVARNAQRLPDWLGLVVTSRPEFDVTTTLQALNPFPLDTQSESNRADIRDYLRRELATPLQNRPDADRLVEQILEKSEGVFRSRQLENWLGQRCN